MKKCRYPMKYAGTLIKNHRMKMNLTQADIARELGYQSTQFISDIERGLRLPPRTITHQLSQMLRISQSHIDQEVIKDRMLAVIKKNSG